MTAGINPAHLRAIVKATLDYLGTLSTGQVLNGTAAEELLMGTAAQESHDGEYLQQLGTGPAKGVWEMEPATHDDCWDNYLNFRRELADKVANLACEGMTRFDQMRGNMWYACAMARVRYLRAAAPMPAAGNLAAQAAYYKRFYNSADGAASVDQYIENAKSIGLGSSNTGA